MPSSLSYTASCLYRQNKHFFSLKAPNPEPSGRAMSAFVMSEARKHARQMVEDYYSQIDISCSQMNFCIKGYHAQATGELLSDRQWLR